MKKAAALFVLNVTTIGCASATRPPCMFGEVAIEAAAKAYKFEKSSLKVRSDEEFGGSHFLLVKFPNGNAYAGAMVQVDTSSCKVIASEIQEGII